MTPSSELDMLRDSARRLIETRRTGHWSSAARTGESDPAFWSEIVDSGWLLAGLDEADGGFGQGAAEVAAIMTEVGRGLVVEPVLANLLGLQIVSGLMGEGREAVIASITEGRSKIALAVSEPGAHYDWRTPSTTLTGEGGDLILNGRKTMVLGGNDADLVLVVVRHGQELNVVLTPVVAEGIERLNYMLVDGQAAADLRLTDVRLRPEALLGRGDCGAVLEKALDFAATAVCAEAVGAMNAAFDMTLDYVKQRVQFGEPIGRNQALQHRLVDLLRMIKEAEILVDQAVGALDGDPVERGLSASAARIHICPAARKVGQESVQLHGAIGTTDEHGISHYFRKFIASGVLFGDLDHHRARFAVLDREARSLAASS